MLHILHILLTRGLDGQLRLPYGWVVIIYWAFWVLDHSFWLDTMLNENDPTDKLKGFLYISPLLMAISMPYQEQNFVYFPPLLLVSRALMSIVVVVQELSGLCSWTPWWGAPHFLKQYLSLSLSTFLKETWSIQTSSRAARWGICKNIQLSLALKLLW